MTTLRYAWHIYFCPDELDKAVIFFSKHYSWHSDDLKLKKHDEHHLILWEYNKINGDTFRSGQWMSSKNNGILHFNKCFWADNGVHFVLRLKGSVICEHKKYIHETRFILPPNLSPIAHGQETEGYLKIPVIMKKAKLPLSLQNQPLDKHWEPNDPLYLHFNDRKTAKDTMGREILVNGAQLFIDAELALDLTGAEFTRKFDHDCFDKDSIMQKRIS